MKDELFEWQKELEVVLSHFNTWEMVQHEREESREPEGKYAYTYKNGEPFYSIMDVVQTDSGMIRVDVDADQFARLDGHKQSTFWQTVGEMVENLEAESVKVRAV